MFKRILVTVLSILSISCTTAKKASEINAVRPPIAPYLKLTCPELITEQRLLLTEVAASGVAVDKAQQSETELLSARQKAVEEIKKARNEANQIF